MDSHFSRVVVNFSEVGDYMAVREDKVRVPVTLTKDFRDKLEEIAKKDNRKTGNLIEKILLDWYEENYNYKDVQR